MKRKITAIVIALSVVLGAAQVYAATMLDTNLVGLIRNGINMVSDFYRGEASGEMDALNASNQAKVTNYVNDKVNTTTNDIKAYKDGEIKRAEQEVNSYFDSMKQAIDSEIEKNVSASKEQIKKDVDSAADTIKENISKEFENQIKEKLKK